MIISNEHKFVFIHIPKTGGTSMTMMLAPHLKGKSSLSQAGRGWQNKFHQNGLHGGIKENHYNSFKDFYKFVIIRNPYDRFGSMWRSGMGGSAKFSFDKFVKTFSIRAYRPQHDHIYENGKLLVDHMIRYENYKEEVEKFFDKFNLELGEMPHRLKTTDRPERSRTITERQADIIYNKYKIDFDTFGYDKDSWINYK
jgi:hypothetical protein